MRIREREIGRPLAITAAVAAVSVAAFLILEFGPWTREPIEPQDRAATRATVRAAGAKVIPTQPKLAVEPVPAGPKPIPPRALGN